MKGSAMLRQLMIACAAASSVAAAHAEERAVPLKDAPGRELVEGNCAACHSLDYIRTNSPFMTAKVWDAEVNKMINAYGAPIEPADAKAITDYLARNYGNPG
jgi:mono/diheme cytochrome c family protein